MTKRYTASDFANARFAEHPDGRHAHRINHPDGWTWAIEGTSGLRDRVNDYHMASFGWVPVPTKPTITENEYERVLAGVNEDYATGYSDALNTFGIEVIPDPKPTNAEKLVEDLTGIYGANLPWTAKVSLSEALTERGWVKAPGGDDEH